MDNQELKTLIEEDKDTANKRLSRKRLFIAFLIVDIVLVIYLVYSLVFLFSHI